MLAVSQHRACPYLCALRAAADHGGLQAQSGAAARPPQDHQAYQQQYSGPPSQQGYATAYGGNPNYPPAPQVGIAFPPRSGLRSPTLLCMSCNGVVWTIRHFTHTGMKTLRSSFSVSAELCPRVLHANGCSRHIAHVTWTCRRLCVFAPAAVLLPAAVSADAQPATLSAAASSTWLIPAAAAAAAAAATAAAGSRPAVLPILWVHPAAAAAPFSTAAELLQPRLQPGFHRVQPWLLTSS